jgi:hypothetical protein
MTTVDRQPTEWPVRRIVIFSSDLAKYAGYSTFESSEEITAKFWRANWKLAKQLGIHDKCPSPAKTNTEQYVASVQPAERDQLCSKLDVDCSASDTEVAQKLSNHVVAPAVRVGTNEAADKVVQASADAVLASMPTESKKRGRQAFEADVRVDRAVQREAAYTDEVQSAVGKRIVQRNTKCMSKPIGRCGPYTIVLIGKVDGVFEQTGEVVELKERRHRLFGCVRDYEKVQLHCYMKLTSTDRAVLCERYDADMQTHHVEHDPGFWDDCMRRLHAFVANTIEVGA